MKKIIVFIFLSIFSSIYATSMGNYCSTPPFLSTSVSPNILFVVDRSGSMSWCAYNPDTDKTDCCNRSSGCGWIYTGDEEGYFIPDKLYRYDDDKFIETTGTPSPCPNRIDDIDFDRIYKGSCLNFLYMTRIDLLRWAITGGKPAGCSDSEFTDPDCDPDLRCSEDTCILETHLGIQVEVPKSRIKGITQIFENEENRPRFGVLFYSTYIYSDKVYIGDYPNGNNADPDNPYTYLKRAINSVDPSGFTGTSPAMWEAYDYFKQSNDHNYSNGFSLGEGTYKDPNYFCDANRENCKPVPCAKNFVILASDGQWNYGGEPPKKTCTIDEGFENYSADPVVPAYKMHSSILRTLYSLSGIPYDIKVDGVYALGLFLGGTGEQSLKNIAVYGSFDTDRYTWPAGTTGYPGDTCYMDNCGDGKGSACTPLPPSSPDWDKDGDGVPDTFLSAKNATEIKNSLLKFIRDILEKTSSGTSVSVLAERSKKGAVITQALFYPQKNIGDSELTWIGYLYSYWFLNTKLAQNIREDTVQDKKLNLLDDYILNFYIDNAGTLKIDACESDATGNPTTSCITKSIDEVSYLWEAGEVLKDTSASDRKLYVPCTTECGSSRLVEFSTDPTKKVVFESFLGTDIDEFPSCLGDDLGDARENIIKYVRGEDISGCRSRTLDDGSVWKLGDIVYSTPKIVDYQDYSVVFTASNDGILHAFKLGKLENINLGNDLVKLTGTDLGSELWGFIPKNALPYLRYLADPDYCHIYINDLSPYIIYTDYNGDSKEEIILIGGMRLGGGCGCTSSTDCINPPSDTCPDQTTDTCTGRSAYYALDITDPENPVFLWEFSHKDLGFSFSGPAFVKRLDESANLKQFVIFASGPTSLKGYSSQSLKIFVLDLQTGNLLLEKDIPELDNAFGGRLFTDGLDVNSDGQTDYVFLGYTQKIEEDETAQGGIIKIWTGNIDPTKWDFDSTMLSFVNNPITSKIETGKCFNNWYLFFGTGRFFYKTDDDSNINALYGVPFRCDANNDCPTETINPVNVTTEELVCGNIGDPTQGAWMIQLDGSTDVLLKERNIASPTFAKNIIFFATTQPSSDLCGYGGYSRAWAMNCATGDAVSSDRCPGYTISIGNVKYLLQLSGGNIEQFGLENFSEEGGRATQKVFGITSEEGGLPIMPGGQKGEIILWIER